MVDQEKGLDSQVEAELLQAEIEVRRITGQLESEADPLKLAGEVVRRFHPLPQVFWRVVNYSIGRSGSIKSPPEGMLFGMKRLILALSKDPALGGGKAALTIKGALESISGDVIAAAIIMQAISKRLKSFELQAVWGPILDDAVLRANLGFYIGAVCTDFGVGRAMLAGFAGRIGLAVLIAMGTSSQAEQAITRLSGGQEIRAVALDIYKTDPILVSALMLGAAGCGRDAVLGLVAFTAPNKLWPELNIHQKRWLAALRVTEEARMSDIDHVPDEMWGWIEYGDGAERTELKDVVQNLKKRGHPWRWLLA